MSEDKRPLKDILGKMVVTKELKKKVGMKQIVIEHTIKELGKQFEITLTRTGTYKPWIGDRADAWITARAGWIENHKI